MWTRLFAPTPQVKNRLAEAIARLQFPHIALRQISKGKLHPIIVRIYTRVLKSKENNVRERQAVKLLQMLSHNVKIVWFILTKQIYPMGSWQPEFSYE
jgi:hypothetical protein